MRISDPVFDDVEADRPEIILFGSGHQHIIPDLSLMAELLKRGVALDVMNTHAACQTYNVLVNAYRLAAVLIQVRE